MTPDYRAALYTLIENAINAAGSNDALFEAVIPRTSRGRVDNLKTVKIVSGPGKFNFGAEDDNRAVECLFTIQCWVMPDRVEDDESMETALDTAMEMAEEIFNAVHNNQSLSNTVCLCDADDYDAEFANHGGMVKAAAYLDGVINPTDVQG
jgi:hypothetical protein